MGGLALALAAAPAAAPALSPEEARAHVRAAVDAVLGLVRGGGSTAQKAAGLRDILERFAALPQIARFAAGRAWRDMSEAQQARYTEAFARPSMPDGSRTIRARPCPSAGSAMPGGAACWSRAR